MLNLDYRVTDQLGYSFYQEIENHHKPWCTCMVKSPYVACKCMIIECMLLTIITFLPEVINVETRALYLTVCGP